MNDLADFLDPQKKDDTPLPSSLLDSHQREREALIRLIDKINDVEKDFTVAISDIREKYKEVLLANADKETRLRAIEQLRDTTNYPELAKREALDHDWIKSFKTTWRIVVGLAMVVSTIIGFILATLLNVRSLFFG